MFCSKTFESERKISALAFAFIVLRSPSPKTRRTKHYLIHPSFALLAAQRNTRRPKAPGDVPAPAPGSPMSPYPPPYNPSYPSFAPPAYGQPGQDMYGQPAAPMQGGDMYSLVVRNYIFWLTDKIFLPTCL